MPKRGYHKEDIKALIHKRGSTLRQISLEAGLCMDGGSIGLHRPIPTVNKAIAEFLGIPAHDLWPDWYDPEGNRIYARAPRKRGLARGFHGVESRNGV